MSDAAFAVSLKGVTRRLGRFQLGPMEFHAPRGSILAFIGHNGAGKTTTLDLMMGLAAADAGEVEVLGLRQPRDEVAIKARTAYAGPDLNFQSWGRVGRALDFVSGFYPDWVDARCARLLADFDLNRAEKIAALSFGARIKLSLVMALSRDAELLLLDEPTVGLDVKARLKLFDEIRDFAARDGRTVIISSHQLTDLERLADHVAILRAGKILTISRMDDLVERYERLEVSAPPDALPAGLTPMDHGLLRDRQVIGDAELEGLGLNILSRSPLTLEAIFVALMAI